MHQYLKAIGFGKIRTKEGEKQLLSEVLEHRDRVCILSSAEEEFQIYEKFYVNQPEAKIGVGCCGISQDLQFEPEYYYPFFTGSGITSYADIMIEKKLDQESYLGICEDAKIGISIIFQLQNAAEYIGLKEAGRLSGHSTSVTLSGLALSGTILFPVIKDPETTRIQKEEARNRMMLLSAAREGNQDAIESLTLEDIDMYSQVSKRLDHEDVFSIVETYFMPYGLECTLYSIMGEILCIQRVENMATKETLYIMTLDVNELQFDICVPVHELVGEPAIGRRFKGNIWLQGRVNF